MCGVSGWFLKPGERLEAHRLTAMADALAHRGPDDRGYIIDDSRGVALAHNRLSIIDLSSAGHQPMVSQDGSDVLVYNGELYNFRDLRAKLEHLGHQFTSRSDTEVVLASLREWGTIALSRFCGMFAIAFWSARSGTLLLARDPLGMKPLYYTPLPDGKGVAFASEIKAFLTLPGFAPRMEPTALRQFLEFGYTFDQERTSLAGVAKLPPGSYLECVNGCAGRPITYFSLPAPDPADRRSRAEREEELHRVLSQVMEEHLIADVPVGLLLSGGLDSSVTAALAARHSRITTISMGFADSKIDERPFARIVSDHIGSDHREVTIHPAEVVEILEEVVPVFDDLFADWGTFSTRLLYQKCRDQGIKVVLVGEGSDEIFGGYPVFEKALQLRGPQPWRLFRLYQRYAGQRYGTEFGAFREIMNRYLAEGNGDLFHAVRLFEARNQVPNNYVMKVDKASMSVSVEARAPFLDRRVAELACRTPRDLLLGEGTSKLLLRGMAERFDLLPREITRRAKFGGSIANSWMDDSPRFRAFARDVILDPAGWTDELGLRSAMTDYFEGRREGYSFPRAISVFRNLAWRLLLLNLWSRHYLGRS
jgi:asparagine synthase (glutamine-hydrolysing)